MSVITVYLRRTNGLPIACLGFVSIIFIFSDSMDDNIFNPTCHRGPTISEENYYGK